MPTARQIQQGVSWTELLAVLAIAAVLALMAAPSFSRVRANAASLAASQALLGALHQARSQALLLSVPAVLCLSADGRRCLSDARRFEARGWLVFVDRVRRRVGSGAPQFDAGDELVRRYAAAAPLRLHGTRAAVTYWPVSRAGTTATFTVCAPRALAPVRAVIVSQSGRPRLRSGARGTAPCNTSG
jgi:type IV fimbrial biogenesis protein FimT